MIFDPEQHEFTNEVREPRKGELFWYGCPAQVLASEGTLGIPVPIIRNRQPAPGTLAWARATVAAGGAVWNEHDELGATVKYAFPSYHEIRYPEDGYHLWGDRDWLAALPDGTRVVHDADGAWVKRDGVWLVRSVGGVEISQPIQHATDSGWDLDRSPDSARDVVELRDQPVPDAFEWRNAANRWREQVEELERRVGALEGKA